MNRFHTALTAFSLLTATAVQAQTVIASNPQSVIDALEAEGHKVALNRPEGQAPHIESWHNGRKFLVLFYNCDDALANCRTLQFYFGFNDAKDTTLERLNEWNRTKRFTRAYRDGEGDPVLEMDLDTDPDGVTQAWFHEQLRTWRSQMDAYREHIVVQ